MENDFSLKTQLQITPTVTHTAQQQLLNCSNVSTKQTKATSYYLSSIYESVCVPQSFPTAQAGDARTVK